MKLVILGANGQTGTALTAQALAAGHQVIAYVRKDGEIAPQRNLTVVVGNLDETDKLAGAIRGADAVVSVIGVPLGTRKTELMRWAQPLITVAMNQAGVSRFVLLSAFGVGETAHMASWYARLIYATMTKGIFEDKAESEKLLPSSGLDYTVLYSVNLKAGPRVSSAVIEPLREVRKVPGLPTLTFETVAAALLELASKSQLSYRDYLVTTAKGWKA